MRNFLKVGGIALGALVLLALIAGAFLYAGFLHFYPAPPKADYPKPKDALEAQRQDLDYFSKLLALDRAFPQAARSEAMHRIGALEQSREVLPRPTLRVRLMEIAALADNGHTRIGYDPGADPMELPVRVGDFSDGIYVMHAAKDNAALLGGRVVAIDGHPISEVMTRLERVRGGTPQWRRLYAEFYLSWQDVLFGTGIAPDMQHSVWTVVTPSGAQLTQTVTPYLPSQDEPFVFTKSMISNAPLKGMGRPWVAFQPDKPLPIALADFARTFRAVRLPHSCTMLVQLKSSDDEGAEKIGDFITATEDAMQNNKPCQLIFDNRFNDGGNYLKTVFFARKLPELIAPGGRIYLLIGPSTFSAGIVTTAAIKQAGGDRVTMLGEPVGDRPQFLSEGNRGCLPNSHLCMAYATGKHDYIHDCTDWDVCFWPNYLFDIKVKSLAPDETITMRFADWRQGRDPVFDRALALASANTAAGVR